MPKRQRAEPPAPPAAASDAEEWCPAGARLLHVPGLPAAVFALAPSPTSLHLFSSSALPPSAALLAALGAGARSVARRGDCAALDGSPLHCVEVRCAAGAAPRLAAAPLAGGGGGGLRAWLAAMEASLRVDTRGLQARVDAEMAALAEAEGAAAGEKESLRARMLADGFTLVATKGATAGGGLGGEEAPRKKKKPSVAEDKALYGFHVQSDKEKRLLALKKAFDADKERIARLKEARRFKPF
jgi:hypothetical protein